MDASERSFSSNWQVFCSVGVRTFTRQIVCLAGYPGSVRTFLCKHFQDAIKFSSLPGWTSGPRIFTRMSDCKRRLIGYVLRRIGEDLDRRFSSNLQVHLATTVNNPPENPRRRVVLTLYLDFVTLAFSTPLQDSRVPIQLVCSTLCLWSLFLL